MLTNNIIKDCLLDQFTLEIVPLFAISLVLRLAVTGVAPGVHGWGGGGGAKGWQHISTLKTSAS